MHVVLELFRTCAQENQPHVRKMAEVSSASVDAQFMKKPQAASVVWNYSGLRADSKGVVIAKEDQKPVWQMHNKSVPAKGGNTSNLMAHLKEHHLTFYAEALSAQPASSKERTQKLRSNTKVSLPSKLSLNLPVSTDQINLKCLSWITLLPTTLLKMPSHLQQLKDQDFELCGKA